MNHLLEVMIPISYPMKTSINREISPVLYLTSILNCIKLSYRGESRAEKPLPFHINAFNQGIIQFFETEQMQNRQAFSKIYPKQKKKGLQLELQWLRLPPRRRTLCLVVSQVQIHERPEGRSFTKFENVCSFINWSQRQDYLSIQICVAGETPD